MVSKVGVGLGIAGLAIGAGILLTQTSATSQVLQTLTVHCSPATLTSGDSSTITVIAFDINGDPMQAVVSGNVTFNGGMSTPFSTALGTGVATLSHTFTNTGASAIMVNVVATATNSNGQDIMSTAFPVTVNPAVMRFAVTVNVKTGTTNLQGATVTIDGGTPTPTNASGNAMFPTVTAGSHTFVASDAGFNSAMTTQNVQANATYNLVLTPTGQTLGTLTVSASPNPVIVNQTLTITTTARDNTTGHLVMPGVSGTLHLGATNVAFGPTNSSGVFTQTGTFANTGMVNISATSGSVTSNTFVETINPGVTVTMITLMATTSTNISAGGSVSFSGVVSGSSGGIAGIQLFVFSNGVAVTGSSPVSGAGGNYTFSLTFPTSTGSPFAITTSNNANGT